MTCADAAALLPSFADRELDEGWRAVVASHLAACPPCEEQVRKWRALRACAWRALRAHAVPPGLRGRIVGELQAQRAGGWLRMLGGLL